MLFPVSSTAPWVVLNPGHFLGGVCWQVGFVLPCDGLLVPCPEERRAARPLGGVLKRGETEPARMKSVSQVALKVSWMCSLLLPCQDPVQ